MKKKIQRDRCVYCEEPFQFSKGRIIDGSKESDVYYEKYKFDYICSYDCYVKLLFKNQKKEQDDEKI